MSEPLNEAEIGLALCAAGIVMEDPTNGWRKLCPGDLLRMARMLLTRRCPHEGATVRNCPYSGDVHNDDKQRCQCCDECAHQCGMDI